MKKAHKLMEQAAKERSGNKTPLNPKPSHLRAQGKTPDDGVINPEHEETLEDQLCPDCHQKVLEHFGRQRMKHA